jgi:hypothetical protein
MNSAVSRHHTCQTQKSILQGFKARAVIGVLIAAIGMLLFSSVPAPCDAIANVVGTDLNVTLGSSNDTATIQAVALGNVIVSGTGLAPTVLSGFTNINVAGTGANAAQSVNFTGGVNVPFGAININGIDTISVDNQGLSAGSFSESGATGGVNISGSLTTQFSQTFHDSVISSGGWSTGNVSPPDPNAGVTVAGGSLTAFGNTSGNLSIVGGTVTPGGFGFGVLGAEALRINGNYRQSGTTGSVYNVLVSQVGNSFIPSFIDVSGSVTLDPGSLLNVSLTGSNPPNGTSFDILDYGSLSGTYTINDPLFNGGTQQWVISSYNGGDGDDIVLTAESAITQTPEPSSILLLGSGLGFLGCGSLLRKRADGRPASNQPPEFQTALMNCGTDRCR